MPDDPSFSRLSRLRAAYTDFRMTGLVRDAGSAALIFGSRLIGAVGALIVILILTNTIGPENAGTVIAVQSAVAFFTLFAFLNFEASAIRALPGAEERTPGATWLFLRSLTRTGLVALPFAGLGAALIVIFGIEGGLALAGLTALMVPASAAVRASTRVAHGLGGVVTSAFFLFASRQIVFIGALVTLWVTDRLTVTTAVLALFLGLIVSGLLQFVFMVRRIPRTRRSSLSPAAAATLIGSWRRTGYVLIVASMLLDEYTNLVTILAAFGLSEADLAVLAILLRVMLFTRLIPSAIMLSLAPRLAAAVGDNNQMVGSAIARRITRLSTLFALLSALVGGLLAPFAIPYFNVGDIARFDLLFPMLAIGVVSAACGPNVLILTAAGANRLMFKVTLLCLAVTVAATVIVAPFGLVPLVWALFLAHGFWDVSAGVAARYQTGISGAIWLPRRFWRQR